MTKAKIVLTAVGIVGLVGAALAFKVRQNDFVFVERNPGSGNCNLKVEQQTLQPGGAFIVYTSATIVDGGNCIPKYIYQGG